MLTPKYALLALRLLWRRWLTPAGHRMRLSGMVFLGRGVQLEIGKHAMVDFGRWVWIGHGTKIRCHEGSVSIGDKTVFGQECTLSAYQRISIGEQCIVADRVMMIDFDHSVADVERPIRAQGIYKRDVTIGNNVWIGYGAQILRGVEVGDNSIIGASSVVTKDVPANAVVAGSPARVVRMRPEPQTLRWSHPVDP
jgi:acetyltransferase-like isoleucine patch superfamily enzyme